MPDCIPLTPKNISTLNWMPASCAYRLLHEGKDLPPWHPLVSGRRASVDEAGIAVAENLPSEDMFTEEELTERTTKKRTGK